jgi:diguanylate cyclase (GGDEF)-like protein
MNQWHEAGVKMTKFTKEQIIELHDYANSFKQSFVNSVLNIIRHEIPSFRITGELEEFIAGLDLLIHELSKNSDSPITAQSIEVLLPYLKRAVMKRRREVATQIDSDKQKTHNSDILKSLEARLKPLDDLLQSDWLKSIEPVKVPRLLNYLSIHQIENFYRASISGILEREYDEKFHILQAPKLFFYDLHHYRQECEMRGTGVVVAYLDIDDFKNKFNKLYGEVEVDRNVLPRFMHTLESHVYYHGFAYRYGGDEYVLLLPNMSVELTIRFLDLLRADVEAIKYRNVESSTTISIGFCHADSDCFLTDREIEERANKAKNFAKEKGKNRIATYKGANFADSDLHIVAPQVDNLK